MELVILMISSILIFSGVPSNAEELRFMSRETDSDHSEDSVQTAWSAFKVEHGKSYSSSEEDQRRRLIFEESLKIVKSHNYLYEAGLRTYEMGINKFSDMEFSEILKMTGFVESNVTYSEIEEEFPALSDDRIPASVDWTTKGYVTPVKNQKSCGSCWAFSATGSLEGQWKKKTGRLVSLSEQNLVDCSRAQGNTGCKGGWMYWAFEYIKKNGGIDTEECYPYEAKDAACRYRPNCRGATVRGYVKLRSGSEEELTMAIANIGPISVTVDVLPSFTRYKSGIYEDPSCSQTRLNHAVLAVGYGISGGRAYYLVKNRNTVKVMDGFTYPVLDIIIDALSWGVEWGANGYILMARNRGNMCGIASATFYPLV